MDNLNILYVHYETFKRSVIEKHFTAKNLSLEYFIFFISYSIINVIYFSHTHASFLWLPFLLVQILCRSHGMCKKTQYFLHQIHLLFYVVCENHLLHGGVLTS